MIVVVIMGVLAGVAILSYQVYIRRARTSEAAGLLANIKGQQESYRSEFRMYCNVNDDKPDTAATPQGAAWTNDDDNWATLGFAPDNIHVSFMLNTVAGGPTNPIAPAGFTTNMTLPVAEADFIADHWFVARAIGNQDGDAVQSVFWLTHMTTAVGSYREVE
jgi:Tfp pilus assembly protein PilE